MANDDIILKLECADYDDSRIDAVTRDLARSLREEGVGAAMASQGDAAPGKKGDPVTIGAIVLTLIQTGGVAVTLLQVLKAYLARKSTMRFELTRADGRKVSLDASWFNKAQMEETQKVLTDLLKD
ncbi:MAG TPA: hypothetical protein VHT74_34755 [Acetobacteraceae bacterium]|jgi:hypothetical protein|nr:hypothetical protein [Acetobacteraceae bacterium]